LPAPGGPPGADQRVLRGARIPPSVRVGRLGGGPAARARHRPRCGADPSDPGAAWVVGAGRRRRSEEALLADRGPFASSRRRRRPAGVPRGGPNAVLAVPEGPGPSPALIRQAGRLTSTGPSPSR